MMSNGGTRGVYFSLDAILAATIIFGGLILISQLTVLEQNSDQIDFVAEDLLTALDQIPISSINNSFIQSEIASGNISDPSNSVLEQIATYWALNETDKATRLAETVLNRTIPEDIGARLQLDPDEIFLQNNTVPRLVVAANRMVAGIDKGKPLAGSSSYGYLRNIQDKRSSAYAYFGGFVGQGNVTVRLDELPSDVNSSRITSITMEADLKKNSSVYINGVFCTNISPSTGNLSSDRWDLSACNHSIVSGINNFSLIFDDLNNAYVGGGFIRLQYETDVFVQNDSYGLDYYWFPRISGVVNLFDAFHVPGELNSLTVYLHYLANHSNTTDNNFYLTIGDKTVYFDDNSTLVVTTSIDDAYLSSVLNYSLLSNNTVPIRLGFENLTYSSEYVGRADVVLITDVSGSMDWNFTDDWSSAPQRNCDDPLINDLSTQRLSVAKCLDKDFASSILNVTGNLLGLVSYEYSTDSTLDLTTNLTDIYDEIGMGVGTPVGYVAGGSTCICCGINDAYDMLSEGVVRTILVAQNSIWNFSNSSMGGNIPLDPGNRSWYDPDYSLESTWLSGSAVLGYDAGSGGVTVDTDMGSNLVGSVKYPDLWELTADKATPEVDFTSGLNSSANTYGVSSSDDGWDWSSGVFDYADSFTFFGVWSGLLLMRTSTSGTGDSSGAYAVSINITQDMYDTLSANGTAVLSFYYWWDDYRNYFEDDDEVWVKGRWTSPYSGAHYLGGDYDSDHDGGDSSLEIAARENPNLDITQAYFSQDLASLIEGPGLYYLELGGKLLRSATNEWGYFAFDDILMVVRNNTDHYYFRRHFDVTDLSDVQRGVLNVLADDTLSVYLNGNNLINNSETLNGTYWDVNGLSFSGSNFRLGDNVLAVELQNSYASAKFDLELIGLNDSQQKSMLVMTDGQANVECSRQGWTEDLDNDGYSDTASDDAIQAACDAAKDYGVVIYAVGFGDNADEATLSGIASCGNGNYMKSQNTSELSVFYEDVVLDILEVSRSSQSIVVDSGSLSQSILYPDSYILMNYTPFVPRVSPNEIEVILQSDQFSSCENNITIFDGLRVVDAYITSYSGDHWTSQVSVDNISVFNLTEYSFNYSYLGDPFTVQIPAYLLTSGNHSISIYTGDDGSNTTGCSLNNSLIYRAMVNASTSRSSVVQYSGGCSWVVTTDNDENQTFDVPSSYSGSETCYYTPNNISYDVQDAYDVAVYSLLASLDFDGDGRVLVNLQQEDLEIVVSLVSQVPYLWGPAIVEVHLWQ